MSEVNEKFAYQAVMVRLWRDEPNGPCRASAQLSLEGEIRPFANLNTLFAYLAALAGERPFDETTTFSAGIANDSLPFAA